MTQQVGSGNVSRYADRMKIDEVSSKRLGVLRFPLVVGVVFIHAYGTEVDLLTGAVGTADTGYWVTFWQNLISNGIARTAVPLFFLMSGYFFFLGFSLSIDSYMSRISSRVRTLLIPLLFWNVVTLFLLALAQHHHATQSFFSGKNDPIVTFGLYDYLNAIFAIDRYPISYQFWFIRDLLVMVLISPVICLILKKLPNVFLLAIFTLWFLEMWPIYIPSAATFAFFYAGAYVAQSDTNLFALDRFGIRLVTCYLAVLIIDTATKDYIFNTYIHKTGILIGIASVFFVTKAIIETTHLKRALLWASGCSFFVFAVHEPLLTVVKKISYKVFVPSSDIAVFFLYLMIPVFIIIFSVVLFVCMKFIAPRFLGMISGGR